MVRIYRIYIIIYVGSYIFCYSLGRVKGGREKTGIYIYIYIKYILPRIFASNFSLSNFDQYLKPTYPSPTTIIMIKNTIKIVNPAPSPPPSSIVA